MHELYNINSVKFNICNHSMVNTSLIISEQCMITSKTIDCQNLNTSKLLPKNGCYQQILQTGQLSPPLVWNNIMAQFTYGCSYILLFIKC